MDRAPETSCFRVKALQPSRWRGGLQFTPEARILPLPELTLDQVKAIVADPVLSVEAAHDGETFVAVDRDSVFAGEPDLGPEPVIEPEPMIEPKPVIEHQTETLASDVTAPPVVDEVAVAPEAAGSVSPAVEVAAAKPAKPPKK